MNKYNEITLQVSLNRYYIMINNKISNEEVKVIIKWLKELRLRKKREEAMRMNFLGQSYEKIKDYKEALQWYKLATKKGNSFAEINIGELYWNGIYVYRDVKEFLKWTNRAVEKGNTIALNRIANAYKTGYKKMKPNGKEAMRKAYEVYQLSAGKGDTYAMAQIGFMHLNNSEIEIDYKKAFEMLMKAAEKEEASGYVGIAEIYINGYGVEINYKKAKYWIDKAVDQGDTDGICLLAYLYEYGLGVKENKKMVFNIYTELAKTTSKGKVKKANCYRYSVGVDGDCIVAHTLYKEAVSENKNEGEAMIHIGAMYYYGCNEIKQDYKEARKWFRKAANLKECGGYTGLADLYRNGYGVKQDYKKAYKWTKKAADCNYMQGQYDLADIHYNGEGVEKDYKKAIKLYKIITNGSNGTIFTTAANKLAKIYSDGKLVKKNIKETIRLYALAKNHEMIKKLTEENTKIIIKEILELNKLRKVIIKKNEKIKNLKTEIKYAPTIKATGFYNCKARFELNSGQSGRRSSLS